MTVPTSFVIFSTTRTIDTVQNRTFMTSNSRVVRCYSNIYSMFFSYSRVYMIHVCNIIINYIESRRHNCWESC